MNDGNAPRKRSVFSYILPYLLMAATIGVFVWLIVSQFSGGGETWSVSDIDRNIGYVLNDEGTEYKQYDVTSYSQADKKIISANASQNYRAVTVSGTYLKNNNLYRYSVVIGQAEWEEAFEASGIKHASYHDVFFTAVEMAKSWVQANGYENKLTPTFSNTDAFQVSWWDSWGPTLISTGIILLIGILFFSRINGSINGANNQAMSFNKSPARRADNTKVRFDDVAGCDAEKAEMVELVAYLKDPKKYSQFGARLPKGVLLIGPPGTGKTLLAKAVAGEAGVAFYSISGSDFVEMYVGVGAGRVRDLFKKAKQSAPCLIFIDEIDAVGRQRGAGLGGGNDEREQTLNQLLVEMDGFEANSGILVIAATNRDDVLDPALRRAGRFDRTITVSLPDAAGREAILKVHARNKKLAPGIDFHALSKRTVGFSGADLDNVLNEAAILAVREGKSEIEMSDIDEAIDRRISGPARASKGMSDHERREVAYHEAGHAVIGINLPYSDKVQKITIIPRGNTGGHVLMTPDDDRFLLTKNEMIARITGLLGGRASEEIFFGDVTTGASNDIQEATRLARSMVTEYGMSELGPIQYERDTGSVFLGRDYASTQKNFSTQVAYEIDKAGREIIETAYKRAHDLLIEHKDEVIKIAETLLEKETITAEEIDGLLGKVPAAEEKAPEAKEEPKPKEKPAEEAKPADPKPSDDKPEDK